MAKFTPRVWLLAALIVPILWAEQNGSSQHARPAPQVSGKFIHTDGRHELILEYVKGAKAGTFTGTTYSTCMLPSPAKSGEGRPLNLSMIPAGTMMTLFYVSQPGKHPQNLVLAVRFDHLRGPSTLPQGVSIPCFKASREPKQ